MKGNLKHNLNTGNNILKFYKIWVAPTEQDPINSFKPPHVLI